LRVSSITARPRRFQLAFLGSCVQLLWMRYKEYSNWSGHIL
jgi:hypothetical protein